MVRLGMTNPQYVLRYLDDLINILKDKKMFKFLHIPLQSGSDKILSDMNRPYSQKDYIKIIKKLKKHHPDLTISTDIIVGFPTETDKDFQDTLECIRSTRPDILNISRYWPRPGTKAAALKQLDGKIVKERSKVLLELFNKISKENNSRWLGWQGSVLIDEVGKDDSFIGRNYAYKPIIVKGRFKLGEKINVKITETTVHDLRGHLMNV
jgi:MiaB/RimO family radical SAM methylthiotransferase